MVVIKVLVLLVVLMVVVIVVVIWVWMSRFLNDMVRMTSCWRWVDVMWSLKLFWVDVYKIKFEL